MGTQATIDSLKRMALTEIVKNLGVKIPSVHLVGKINEYIRYGSTTTLALSTLFTPPSDRPTFADFSAKILLSYLHLYSQYVVNLSSYESISSLSIIAFSKYNYIFFKYEELYSMFEKKKLEKKYRYAQYIDFAIPSSIYSQAFSNTAFGLTNIIQLSYKDLLSLPILSTKTIYPDMLNSYIDDATISKFTYKSDNKNIFCSINRVFGDHIGTIKTIDYMTQPASGANDITFSGKINGFIASTLFFKVVSINPDTENFAFEYSTSLDGKEWEATQLVTEQSLQEILILSDMQSGIYFTVENPENILQDSIWALNLNYITLAAPKCNIKAVFNTIHNLSYIGFKDISATVLSIAPSAAIKFSETDTNTAIIDNVKNDMQNYIPINNQIYSADISMQQDSSKIVPDGVGGIAFKYDFDIADIVGVSNSYYKIGSIVFNPLEVNSISHISMDSLGYIKAPPVGNAIANSFIMYTLVVETKFNQVEIPILPSNFYTENPGLTSGGKYFAAEPLLFNQNFSNDSYLLYDLKHDFVDSVTPGENVLYELNPYSVSGKTPDFYDNGFENTTYNYRKNDKIGLNIDINRYYAYKGLIRVNDMHATTITDLNDVNSKWIVMSNRMAYMFYINEDGKLQISIKMQGEGDSQKILYPFTGKIYGKISMLSSDESHVSPYIFNYSLGCI